MQPSDAVGDKEHLYRNIRAEYGVAGNPPHINPEGFFDEERKPSVDRAMLCAYNASYTRRNADGVAILVAKEVRDIGDIYLGEPAKFYGVNVISDPIENDAILPDNPAHAKIVLDPWFDHKKLFRRLRHSLARLAESRPWAIPPE